MKNLFLKLYEAFKESEAKFIEAGLPAIETVDRYRGQSLDPEAFEYFGLPAIFIGKQVAWETEGDIWQGVATLDFHIVSMTFGETGMQYTSHEEGLKYYSLVAAIRRVLDNFNTAFTSKLQRSTDREVDTGVIIYDVLSYTCTIWDDEAAPEPKYVDTEDNDLDIRGSLVKKLKRR